MTFISMDLSSGTDLMLGLPVLHQIYRTTRATAMQILRISDPDACPVSERWPRRWIKSHPQFPIVKQKPIEKARADAMSAYNIHQWFKQLEQTMEKYNIQPSDFWNMGEMGLRIGIGRNSRFSLLLTFRLIKCQSLLNMEEEGKEPGANHRVKDIHSRSVIGMRQATYS